MKDWMNKLRDVFIAGLIFLLPLLTIFALLAKVNQFVQGFFKKIAGLFGLKSIAGISAATWVGFLSFLVICLLLGWLVKHSFIGGFRNWLDSKLVKYIPGYAMYREMALSKLIKQEELLPYDKGAWYIEGGMQRPCFIIEEFDKDKMVIFLPMAGNTKSGYNALVAKSSLQDLPVDELKKFKLAVDNIGIGLNQFAK